MKLLTGFSNCRKHCHVGQLLHRAATRQHSRARIVVVYRDCSILLVLADCCRRFESCFPLFWLVEFTAVSSSARRFLRRPPHMFCFAFDRHTCSCVPMLLALFVLCSCTTTGTRSLSNNGNNRTLLQFAGVSCCRCLPLFCWNRSSVPMVLLFPCILFFRCVLVTTINWIWVLEQTQHLH